MNELLEPGDLRELRELRAEVTGRRPQELHQARAALLAEVHRAPGASAPGHRHRRLRRRGQPVRPHAARWLRPVILAGAAAAAAALAVSLLPGAPGGRPGPHQNGSGPRAGTQVLTAAYVLGRAASAAAATRQPVPRPDQY